MGAAAFWIFLAVLVVMVNWRNKHRESLRYETLRFLIEKNQKLDDAQLTELLNPKPGPPPEWLVHKPGYAYKGLRATGIVFIFLAIGLAMATAWCAMLRPLAFGFQATTDFQVDINKGPLTYAEAR
jgi:hypothetical protein